MADTTLAFTTATAERDMVEYASSSTEWQKTADTPWLVPHAEEHQKHVWYSSQLGIGNKEVKDEWGFSSASVSRSHSPYNGQ